MLHKTRGICINYIKYKETSIITRIYTEKFGMKSYIVNGVRSARAKMRMALFQPITLLDLVVYENEKRDINRISEIKTSPAFTSIPFDITKSSIAIFLCEFLYKILKEGWEDQRLFQFVFNSIYHLDLQSKGVSNFHLQFLLKIGRELGIEPYSMEMLLDEVSSVYVTDKAFLDKMKLLSTSTYEADVLMNGKQRGEILKIIIEYYRRHYDFKGEMKSLSVLQEVMS